MSFFVCESCGTGAPLSEPCTQCESDAEARRALELADAATYGPWSRDGSWVMTAMRCWLAEVANLNGNGAANAIFMAAARDLVPSLARQVLSLQARLLAGREALAERTKQRDQSDAGSSERVRQLRELRDLCPRTFRHYPFEVVKQRLELFAKEEAGRNKEAARLRRDLAIQKAQLSEVITERDAARREVEDLKAKLAEMGSGAICAYCDVVIPRTEMKAHILSCKERGPEDAANRHLEAFMMREEAIELLGAAEKLAKSAPEQPLPQPPRSET